MYYFVVDTLNKTVFQSYDKKECIAKAKEIFENGTNYVEVKEVRQDKRGYYAKSIKCWRK